MGMMMAANPDFANLLRQPLAKGAHDGWDGQQCVMERVSMLWAQATGQNITSCFSDLPACTNEVVARTAQYVNDTISDEDRQRLNAFLPRLLRARRTDNDRRINVRLAVWAARSVLHLVRAKDREVCEKAITAAETWLEDADAAAADAAYDAASAAHAAPHAAHAAAYAADAAAAAAYAPHAAHAPYAANAAAYDAANAAYAAYAAHAADAANADYVGFLDELLDAWEEVMVKEGHDLYIPQAWEEDALAFALELGAE